MTSTDSERVEEALDRAFPFAGFLQSLRRVELVVGIREMENVARLLERWQGTDRGQLRDAIAAVLGRNREDVARIRTAFDDWFAEADSQAASPAPQKRLQRSGPRWRRLPWVAAAIAAILAGLASWLLRPPPPPSPPSTSTIQPPSTSIVVTQGLPSPLPLLPPPPRRDSGRAASWLTGIAAALFALTAAAGLRARGTREQFVRRIATDELSNTPGPHRYDMVVTRASPPIPRSWVEEAATIIGRGAEAGATSDELDVDDTLRQTLREGLRPVLAFAAPPHASPLLVLEDTAPAMRPWRGKVAYFLSQLVREGVSVERWGFETSPGLVARTSGGRMPLQRLADRTAERALLIISTGDGFDTVVREHRQLAVTLRRWGRRSWLNPIANRRYWPGSVAAVPMHVWPLTRNGLRALAWEIATAPYALAEARGLEMARDVTADDVERLKRLIALVPSPTLALAEELRKRFCDDVPEEVLLALAGEGVVHGDRIILPAEEVRRLVEDGRRDAPRREQHVREYLLEVLRISSPPAGSVARLRWQIACAVQEVHLASASGREVADSTMTRLESLAEGPLAREVRSAVEMAHVPAAVRTNVRRSAARYVRWASHLAPRWAAPGSFAIVLAAVLGLLAYGGIRRLSSGAESVVAHVSDAYRLQYVADPEPVAGRLGVVRVERIRSDAPAPPSLYIGQTAVTLPALPYEHPVTMENSGSWWQARRRLPPGNLAVSNFLWIPKMRIVMTQPRLVTTMPETAPMANASRETADTPRDPAGEEFARAVFLGRKFYQLGDFASAFDQLEKASRIRRDDAAVLHYSALTLAATGRYSDALQFVDRSLSLYPEGAYSSSARRLGLELRFQLELAKRQPPDRNPRLAMELPAWPDPPSTDIRTPTTAEARPPENDQTDTAAGGNEEVAEVFVSYETDRILTVISAASNLDDENVKSKIFESAQRRVQLLSNLRLLIELSGDSKLASAVRAAGSEQARLAFVTQLFGETMPPHWAPEDAVEFIVPADPEIETKPEAVLRDSTGRYSEAQKKRAFFILLGAAETTEEERKWLLSVANSLLR